MIALLLAVVGLGWTEVTPQNGVWDDYYRRTSDAANCSFRFQVTRPQADRIGVEAYVRDDRVVVDNCPEKSISCETWKDDCLEVFFDGDDDRNPNTRGPDYETNPTPCNAGGEYAIAANGSSQSDYASAKKCFGQHWGGVAEAWLEGGRRIGTHYKLWFDYACLGRTAPSADESVSFGFNICVHDDDDGGANDLALYWRGNPKIPYADESKFGRITLPAMVESRKALGNRTAVIYSDYGGGLRQHEFDGHLAKLKLTTDRYLNTKLADLSNRLNDYDFVIATTLANYTKCVDIKPFAKQWTDWLRKGGIFLIVDANYSIVVQKFVDELGKDFSIRNVGCSLHQANAAVKAATADLNDSLMLAPLPLGKLLEGYSQWQHLTGLGPDWHCPVKCPHNEALFAYREYGDGLVAVACAAEMKQNPIGEALLTNLLAYRKSMKHGVKIVSVGPSATDVDELTVGRSATLIDRSHRHQRFRAQLTAINGKGRASAEASYDVGKDGKVVVSPKVKINRRGDTDCELKIFTENGDSVTRFKWSESLAPALKFELRRKHVFHGDRLRAKVALNLHRLGNDRLRGIAWRLDDGAWNSVKAEDGEIAVDATKLTQGRHTIAARLDYDEQFLKSLTDEQRRLMDWGETVEREFFVHGEPKYRMRDDHVLLRNGKPIFPIGWYSVIGGDMPQSLRLEMVKEIAGWGYNLAHVGATPDDNRTDSYGKFLDECEKLGVDVITEHCGPELVKKYKGKAAVLAWNPGDEPAYHGISPAEMFARYDRFKQIDPDHMVYTVICRPAQYAKYAAGTDILSPDPYPLPGGLVDAAYRMYHKAKLAADETDTALWAVPQAFGYMRKELPTRAPTGREFKAMSYLAIMAGAKGLIYYTHHDRGFDIHESSDLLTAAKEFPAELKEFIPFVLDGKMEMLVEEANGVYVAGWTLGNDRWLVAVNAARQPKRAKFKHNGRNYDFELGANESRSWPATPSTPSNKQR